MAKRFERAKRNGVRMTKRDFKIVEAIFEARYMTNRMIGRFLFKPTTFFWCKHRIRCLFDLGYLKKRSAYMNEPDVYFLGLKGRRYIVSLGQYTREQVDKVAGVLGRNASTPTLMMNHQLTLSRLYVNARLECREYGWDMRWKNTRMLELERLGIEPDAWIEVSNGDRRRQAFIEFTTVVPTKTELSGKTEGCVAYWERTRQPIPVLWLTTSRNKLNRLCKGILGALYKDYFLVGLIEDAGRFLTKPLWRWTESEQRVSWLSPLEKTVCGAGGRR